MDLKSIVVKNKEIEVNELDGQKVMMNLEVGKYFMLNLVGSDIWEKIEKESTVEEIRDALIKIYEIEETKCLNSVIEYLEQLKGAGLIEIF